MKKTPAQSRKVLIGKRGARKIKPGFNIFPKAFIVIATAAIWISLMTINNQLLNIIFHKLRYYPEKGDYAGKLLDQAINLHHSISESSANKSELFQRLNEPVAWYSKKRLPFHKLKLGSDYDGFGLIDKPRDILPPDTIQNNYRVQFEAMYRLRRPTKKTYVIFQGGEAIIEQGRITSLTSKDNRQENNHKWLNALHRWYCLLAWAVSLLCALVLANFKEIIQILKDIFPSALTKILGRYG